MGFLWTKFCVLTACYKVISLLKLYSPTGFQMYWGAVELGCCFSSVDQGDTDFACLKHELPFLMEAPALQCPPFSMNIQVIAKLPFWDGTLGLFSALFFWQHSWQAGSNRERRNALITVTLFSKSVAIVAPCKYRNCLSCYELRSLEAGFGVSIWVEALLFPPSCLQVPFNCDYGHLLYRAES